MAETQYSISYKIYQNLKDLLAYRKLREDIQPIVNGANGANGGANGVDGIINGGVGVNGGAIDEKSLKKAFINNITYYEFVLIPAVPIDVNDKRRILVYILSQGSKYSTRSVEFKKLLTKLPKNPNKNIEVIIIVDNELTSNMKTIIKMHDEHSIEVINYNRLKINITKSSLCYPHRILSEEEVKMVLDDLSTVKAGLPKILMSDPQCIWLGAKPGDVIEIQRCSEATGTSIAYRAVA